MSATRYEILLPLRHNDGREVEAEKLLLTKNELIQKFGALTVDPHPLEGRWTQSGVTYEDMLLKYTVDVERDTDEIQQFLPRIQGTVETAICPVGCLDHRAPDPHRLKGFVGAGVTWRVWRAG